MMVISLLALVVGFAGVAKHFRGRFAVVIPESYPQSPPQAGCLGLIQPRGIIL
jgi:hypothetical protein